MTVTLKSETVLNQNPVKSWGDTGWCEVISRQSRVCAFSVVSKGCDTTWGGSSKCVGSVFQTLAQSRLKIAS